MRRIEIQELGGDAEMKFDASCKCGVRVRWENRLQDSNVELQDLVHVRVVGIGGFGNVRCDMRHHGEMIGFCECSSTEEACGGSTYSFEVGNVC